MSNLYEHFNCSSKEELYQKVKDDNASVRSLVDFIDYSKGEIENKHEAIRSPKDFIELVSHNTMPEKEEVVAVFCSTKNEPLHVSRFNMEETSHFKNVVREGLNAGGVSIFYLANEASHGNKEMEIKNHFNAFGIEVIDGFRYDELERTVTSNREPIAYPVPNHPSVLDNVAENEIDIMYHGKDAVNAFEGFDEFASYFANREMTGLDIVADNKALKKSLKTGYQYDWQESFGVISCNKDGEVVSVSELFKGSPNSSIVDRKVFAKEILSRDDIRKVAVFHNHPSGDPKPSVEDMNVTKGLKTLTEKVDIELLDHFIVGKKNVYSFAKESPEYVSDNRDYKETIHKQARKKHQQHAFDFDM